jgi:hypothetical protein
MKTKTVGIVSGVFIVVGTALIVQIKLHVHRPSDGTVSQSDGAMSNTMENKNDQENIKPVAGRKAVTNAQASNSENPAAAHLERHIDRSVRKSTRGVKDALRKQRTAARREKWYRETYEVTKERLKHTDKPQTVHGKIGFRELYESVNEPAVIVAILKDLEHGADRHASESMIVDGAYSLGQLNAGTYEAYLNETSKTPGIWGYKWISN